MLGKITTAILNIYNITKVALKSEKNLNFMISAVKMNIGRKILEEAQDFLPEVEFLKHVDVVHGI